MLPACFLAKSVFKASTRSFICQGSTTPTTVPLAPPGGLSPPTQYKVSCLVRAAAAGNEKEGTGQVRVGSEVLIGARRRHPAHRHEHSAPGYRARAGGVPTSPRGPAQPASGDPAPQLGAGSPVLPETLVPGPAAGAGPAGRERGAAPPSRRRQSPEPPGKSGGGLQTTRGGRLGREHDS